MFSVIMMFLYLIKVSTADTEVSCVVMEICILPCSFQGGDDTVIHWIKMAAGHPRVHSFYQNRDQLGVQDQRFRGRTSLFQDQISRGNVSLQLTGVKVQDQGRYECLISTISGNKDTFINLKVDAPVRKVSIDQVGNRITCSSNWIHPEPELTWSTSPPSNTSLQNTATVQQAEQQLYNISSSLILSDSDTDLIYSCTVSTRTSSRRATWRQISSVIGRYSEATISCSASNTSLTSLIWRFNHSQIILIKPGPDVTPTVSEEWRQHVKDVSESGSLTLQDLTSHQEGTYTCELSNSEETMLTVICLKMSSENSANVAVIIVPVIGAIFAVIFFLVMFCKKAKDQSENRTSDRDETSESRDVQDTHEAPTDDVPSDSNQRASNIPLIQSDEDSDEEAGLLQRTSHQDPWQEPQKAPIHPKQRRQDPDESA
ncbi:uncharacterized protein PAE49_021976 isoform 2-T2 [Odontesthes bonariensis]|uniref:uncharacterized protein LOC142370178 isoform X2 n=1 Tax=Odontesthes bonariensis TaxID=219752 RepID=UPI003F581AE6